MKFTLVALLALAIGSPALARQFTLINKCSYTVWPGTLSNPNHGANPGGGGFELKAGAQQAVSTPEDWAGRFYPRTTCDFSKNPSCQTGDCGGQKGCKAGVGGTPPATLAEFTLKGAGGNDFYDVSNVDGFNVPVTITPVKLQSGGDQYFCKVADCPVDLNNGCPAELQDKVNGKVVGCKSACLALNKPEYCCTGDHGQPSTCPPTNYSKYFKNKCPHAYSYAYDDKTSTYQCKDTDYKIQFC